jgi:hypothetical protein
MSNNYESSWWDWKMLITLMMQIFRQWKVTEMATVKKRYVVGT